jgi:hypothetical protein
MTITKSQLLSTGAALRHVEMKGTAPGEVQRVTIDGNEVDPAAARKALADAEQEVAAFALKRAEAEQAAQENPSVWRRAMTSIGGTVSSTTDYLKQNVAAPTGRWLESNLPTVKWAGEQVGSLAAGAVTSDPEDVARKATVQIVLKGGGTLDVPVMVVDATAANLLKATSVIAGTAAIVPLVGNFIQGGTGILCYLASGASYLLGDDDLGRSLVGMGNKHVRLGLIGFVPGGNVVTTTAAARDATRFTDGVPLDQLVSKG